MSQTSQFFKVVKTKRSHKRSSFKTENVRKWLAKIKTPQYFDTRTENLCTIVEENEDIDEIDWDEVELPVKIRTRKSFDSFVRPKTPGKLKPKIFKPTILIHHPPESTIFSGRDSFNSEGLSPIPTPTPTMSICDTQDWNSLQLNYWETENHLNSFSMSQSDSQSLYSQPSAFVNASFQRINQLISTLHSYSDESGFESSINSRNAQNDLLNSTFIQESQELQEPKADTSYNILNLTLRRAFNENSIDPLLAFNNPKEFIKLVHQENILFESEENIEDYIDNQIIDSQKDRSIAVIAHLNHSVSDGILSRDTMLQKGINRILQQENFAGPSGYQRSSQDLAKDTFTLYYRKIFAELNRDIDLGLKVKIAVPRVNWKTAVYKDGVLTLRKDAKMETAILRERQNNVLYLLRKIYSLMMLNTNRTQRSIYYQLKSLLPEDKSARLTQAMVSSALNILSSMVNMPYWSFGVYTTSKGLIYGDLTLTIGSTVITCNAQNGTNIPMDLDDLRKVESNAFFILIVEKDTVFQKLLIDDLPNKLSRNFIIITGKGFPDVTTRRLLNVLWKLLGIPMFIVVDADAYGVDIFLTYKFGSLNHCHMSQYLSLPKLKWLGILPSELKNYDIKSMPLQENDSKKLKSMLTRPYFKDGNNAAICNEITTLIANKKKCDIEGLYRSNLFFSNVYLPTKLYKRSFV